VPAVPTLVRELNDDFVLSVKMILYSVQRGCIACTYSEKGCFQYTRGSSDDCHGEGKLKIAFSKHLKMKRSKTGKYLACGEVAYK
jgi:geranylgeranyl pyrophosphate synthase